MHAQLLRLFVMTCTRATTARINMLHRYSDIEQLGAREDDYQVARAMLQVECSCPPAGLQPVPYPQRQC